MDFSHLEILGVFLLYIKIRHGKMGWNSLTQPDKKLYNSHGRPRHLSTIPLKDSHLFKIAESVISFYLKFFF